MNLSRRELAGALLGTAASVASAQQENVQDDLAIQRERRLAAEAELAKFTIETTLEPSFIFRP